MTDLELSFERLDFADDALARKVYAVGVRSRVAQTPGFVPPPYDEWRQLCSTQHPDADQYHLVALVDAEPVAEATVWLPVLADLTMAWVSVHVDPPFRRRGIGSALVAEMERTLDPARTVITGPVVQAVAAAAPEIESMPGVRFAVGRGYGLSTTSRVRKLRLPIDPEIIASVEADIGPFLQYYRIETHVDGVPVALRESLGVLKGFLDVDAPSGDLEWEPAPVSPEVYAHELDQHRRSGTRLVETLALTQSGEVAAYTETLLRPGDGRDIGQEGTLVAREHRGHRLGLAVKLANIRALQALGGNGRSIVTENDDANSPMIAVNERLGFQVTGVEAVMTKRR